MKYSLRADYFVAACEVIFVIFIVYYLVEEILEVRILLVTVHHV